MFLESAKNSISEDCLLGLGYLLNVRDDSMKEVQMIFNEMPCTDLNLQLELYYYSLKLYKKVNPSDKNIFIYDPIELICFMSKITEYEENQELVSLLHQQMRLLSSSSEIDVAGNSKSKDEESEEKSNFNSVSESTKSSKEPHTENTLSSEDQNYTEAYVDESKLISQNLKYNVDDENGDGWDEWENEEWDDFPDQGVQETKDNTMDEIPSIRSDTMTSLCENATEEERFEIFEKMFSEIGNKNQYLQVKETLKQWPDFIDPEIISVDKNPMLRLVIKSMKVMDTSNANYETQILQEFKDILGDREIPKDVSASNTNMVSIFKNFESILI